jgi:hypothetical protein
MDSLGEPLFRACQRLLLQRYGFLSRMPRVSPKPTIVCRLSKYFQWQSAMWRLHPFSTPHILQSRSWANQPQWLVQDIRCKKDLKGSQQSL